MPPSPKITLDSLSFLLFNLSLIGLLFFPLFINAQKSNYSGLPLSAYKDGRVITFSEKNEYWLMMQDSQGYMWGYNEDYETVRFDGVEYEVFVSDPNDSTSIQPTSVLWPKFINSHDGKLWIKQGGGVDRYNPTTKNFEHFHNRIWGVDSVGPNIYNCFFEDSKGNLWVGGSRQLYVILKDGKTIIPIKNTPHVHLILEDINGDIWVEVGTANFKLSLAKINLEKKEAEWLIGGFDFVWRSFFGGYSFYYNDAVLTNQAIEEYLVLSQGDLYLINLHEQKNTPLKTILKKNENAVCIYKKGGTILIGTNKNRILKYFPSDRSASIFIDFSHIEEKGEILKLFLSRDGILWAVGNKNTYQVLPKNTPFEYIPYPPDILRTNASARHDLLVEFRGKVYFNTFNGLKPTLQKTGSKTIELEYGVEDFELHENNKAAKTEQPDDIFDLSGLIFAENKATNTLWMLMHQYPFGIKLFHFDNEGKRLDYYACEGRDENCFDDDYMGISIDRAGNLWMAGWRVATKFNTETHSFFNLTYDKEKDLALNNQFVTSILADHNQNIWIGYMERGISRFDPATASIQHLMYEQNNPHSLISNQRVHVMKEAKDNHICIGSEAGLSIWNPETNHFKRINKSDGLAANYIESIGVDRKGNLWMPMLKQISHYDFSDSTVYVFDYRDGYKNVHSRKFFSDNHNNLFFPSGGEIIHFNANDIKIDKKIPPLLIKEFTAKNNKINFSKNVNLNYTQNDFTIQYTALAYLFPEKTTYQYQLEGYDDEWQDNGKKRDVSFTNLGPGDYVFKLKCKNRHGFQSKKPVTLAITILPPWHRTWWAYILWGLLFLSILYGIYRFLLTRRLAQSEAKRLKEMDALKSRLYTNITHEFRTPLTVILGMAEQMKNDPANWFNEGLNLIKRNGKQLLHLVNQLLDLSKLESGSMPLHYVHGDVVAFLKYLSESFHSYADSKDIRLHFLSEMDSLKIDHDPEKLQHVLSNLLSNAIKFTPAGGDIYLRLNKNERGHFQLSIQDTGEGIAEKDLPHIFDRFYQVDTSSTRQGEGTGIGLSLCRELVQLMGGEIMVESEVGKGSNFSITLPISHEHKGTKSQTEAAALSHLATTILSEGQKTEPMEDYIPADKRPLVLLIEDNPDVITYLTALLSTNYELITATNGQAGIEQATEQVPDLIVSDVMMPLKDGFEVCASLKTDERTSHIPIILLTAKSDTSARLEGLTQGADAYLAKPFNKEELLVRMEKLVELRRQLRERFAQAGRLRQFSEIEMPSAESAFLEKTIGIIEANLADEHFGMPELCRQLGMSRTQLFRKLKAVTGKSATPFIRSIRLERAKELLESTDLSVSEVGYRTGFGSAAYFSRAFHREFGVSPSEVRKC